MSYIVNLKESRMKRGLSQSALARKAGLDRQTVSRCENKYSVHELSCEKISNALIEAGHIGDIIINPNGNGGPMPRERQLKAKKYSP